MLLHYSSLLLGQHTFKQSAYHYFKCRNDAVAVSLILKRTLSSFKTPSTDDPQIAKLWTDGANAYLCWASSALDLQVSTLVPVHRHRYYSMSRCHLIQTKSDSSSVSRCIFLDECGRDDACCCCCCCTSTRISDLEHQLKALQLSSIADNNTSKQQLDAWTTAADLHPGFKGNWLVKHAGKVQGIAISDNFVTFDWQGRSVKHLIEKVAPYTFHLQHDSGCSLFVLLPCLKQMVEVNYKEGVRLLWVKKQ